MERAGAILAVSRRHRQMKLGIKRLARLFFAIIGLVLVLGMAYVFSLHAVVNPMIVKHCAVRALSAARTPEELKAAVGPLGCFIKLSDGSWIAIYYNDSHVPPGWSKAIVRDSGGAWFESEHHFCGQFAIYFQLLELDEAIDAEARKQGLADDSAVMRSSQPLDNMTRLMSAPNLDSARTVLKQMEFRPMR
jgi:hypothetical protein